MSQLKTDKLWQNFLREHEADINKEIETRAKVAAQYLEVYGAPATRSDAQKAVWKDFTNNSFVERPMLGVCPAGHVDPLVLACTEGKRQLFLIAQRMLDWAVDHAELETYVRNEYRRKFES